MNFPDSLPCCHFHMGKAYPRNNVSELKLSGTKENENINGIVKSPEAPQNK